MAFFDIFRPRWRHSDPEIRAEAVRGLDDDQQDLFGTIAGDDPDPRVRRVALKRVVDPAELLDLAAGEADPALRALAEERGLAAIFSSPRPRALAAVGKLQSARELVEVVRKAHAAIAAAAVARLADEPALADAAVQAPDAEVRKAALAKIRDADHLREVCLRATDKEIALAALERVNGNADLATIAADAKVKAVRKAATERLGPGAPSTGGKKSKAVSADEKKRRARLLQICIAAENAARSSDHAQAERRLDEARTHWSEIPSGDDDDALVTRFEAAFQTFRAAKALADEARAELAAKKREERRKSDEATAAAAAAAAAANPAPAPAPVEVAPAPAPEPVAPPVVVDTAGMARERLELHTQRLEPRRRGADVTLTALDDAWTAEAGMPAVLEAMGDAIEDVLARRFATARARVQEEVAAAAAERAKIKAERLGKLEAAIASVERRIVSGSTKGLDAARKDATELLRGKPLDEDEAALRAKLEAGIAAFAAKRAEEGEAERWRRWANLPKLEALVKEAEALAEVIPTVEDKSRAPSLLKDLRGRWKAVGGVPPESSKPLWERFDAACNAVHDACKEFFGKVDEERAANLKRKEELCVKAEALIDGADLKATAEALKALQEEWKTAGHVPREQADAIWERFRGACDKFFARYKEAGDAYRAANLKAKEALCVRAEALSGSTNWRDTADELKALQDEWKHTGHVPRAEGDAIWERFRSACDKFFEARKAAFAEADEERAENLKAKEALIVKAESLASEPDREAAQDEAKALQSEWKRIGHVPREVADALWDRFRAACDVLFEDQGEDADAPPPPAENATGLSGFTNRLNLDKLKLPPS